MKIALVHDFFTQLGGADKTFRTLVENYPEADIYTLLSDENLKKRLVGNRKVYTSNLQKIPLAVREYKWFLLLMPFFLEQFDFSDYDVVLSSSSFFTKGIITTPKTLHINYCHTPARFLWHYSEEYIDEIKKERSFKRFVPKFLIKFFLDKIKKWDLASSSRVDYFIANSKNVKKRIKKYYNRDSVVINPPVNVKNFTVRPKKSYYLIGGRLVAHKKYDIALKAFSKMNKKLYIFGCGPEEQKLRDLTKNNKNIKFLGYITDEKKEKLFSEARAFLYPQEEDFGITAIEALASGSPVIGYKKGGVVETIKHLKTGYLYKKNGVPDLIKAVNNFEKINYEPEVLRKEALQYDENVFIYKIKDFVNDKYKKFKEEIDKDEF